MWFFTDRGLESTTTACTSNPTITRKLLQEQLWIQFKSWYNLGQTESVEPCVGPKRPSIVRDRSVDKVVKGKRISALQQRTLKDKRSLMRHNKDRVLVIGQGA